MPRFGTRSGTVVHLGSLLAVFLATACGGNSTPPPDPNAPTNIAIGSGNQQSAKYGTPVPTPPSVVVTNANGVMAGVTVTFKPSTGGSVGSPTAVTNAQGVASVGSWTLAPTPGSQTLKATVGALSVTLTATALTGPPSAVSIQAGNGQTWVTNSRVPVSPSVLVTDGTFPVPGAHVTFAPGAGGGAVDIPVQTTGVNGIATVGGWKLGSVGTNTLTATVTGITPVVFTADAQALVITGFSKDAGDNQTGFAGNYAVTPPTVLVLNQFNQPTQGVPVTFAVIGGGGTVSYTVDTTGNDGRAAIGSWRFGAAGTQTLSAAAATVAPLSFTATATTPPGSSSFDIQLVYMGTPPSTDVQAAFTAAVNRWRQIIVGALPPVMLTGSDVIGPFSINTGITGLAPILCIPQTSNTTINGIRIFVGVQAIDGDQGSNILGLSTPVYVRDPGSLPYAACMIFDSANLDALLATGQLNTVILHEMAHSFGFGTIWTDLALLGGACPTSDLPFFKGPSSKLAFNGALPTGAVFTEPEVPVEGQGSCNDGTRDGHWSEEVFDNELMTGFINTPGPNPLSAVTSASLRDLGYVVNDANSDAYTVPFMVPALRTRATRGTRIHELTVRTPIIVTDLAGHTNRVIDR